MSDCHNAPNKVANVCCYKIDEFLTREYNESLVAESVNNKKMTRVITRILYIFSKEAMRKIFS